MDRLSRETDRIFTWKRPHSFSIHEWTTKTMLRYTRAFRSFKTDTNFLEGFDRRKMVIAHWPWQAALRGLLLWKLIKIDDEFRHSDQQWQIRVLLIFLQNLQSRTALLSERERITGNYFHSLYAYKCGWVFVSVWLTTDWLAYASAVGQGVQNLHRFTSIFVLSKTVSAELSSA